MTRSRWDIFALSERMMQMDEDSWARHANPLSVLSRMTILPLFTLAILSRAWWGWGALVPVGLVVVWVWWNPRAFGKPRNKRSWAAHGTFGERLFLNRNTVRIPPHHRVWALALASISGIGLAPWIYGLWNVDFGFILTGLTLMIGGKLWFVDRMVWLYQDMKTTHPTYATWEE